MKVDMISNAFQIMGKHKAVLLGSLVISIVNQLLVIAVTWIMALGLRIDVSPSYFLIFIPVVTLISMIPISLNGMGLREYAFMSLVRGGRGSRCILHRAGNSFVHCEHPVLSARWDRVHLFTESNGYAANGCNGNRIFMSEKISIIVPIYNERENLEPFVDALTRVLDPTGEDYEVLLIDDGSTDGSDAFLETLPGKNPRIRVIHLSQQFRANGRDGCGI